MTFYNDSFKTAANTPLTGGTPPYISDSGATYSAHQAWLNSAAVEIAAGTRMRGNAAQNNIFNISRAAPGSDHSMTCKVYIASTGNSENTGVICRVTQNTVGYWYSLTIFNGKVRLFKNGANTYLQLGLDVSIAESVGAIFNLILTCIASTIAGTVIRDSDGFYLAPSGAWQGTPINVFSFVDTSVPLTNNVGLWIGGAADTDTTGYQLASASGSAASSAPTPLQVLDAKAGFGAQGLVRGSVIDGSISGNSNVLTSATAGFVASDVGKDICVVSGNSMPPGSNTAFVAPPGAPSLSSCCGTLPATTYYVMQTYVSATGGETIASPESSMSVTPPNTTLLVQQPPTSGTGWNVYVSAQLQTPSAPTLTLCSCGGSLPASTTYRYKITAVDIRHPVTGNTAETGASGENSIVTSSTNINSVILSWTAVQRAVAYNVYRASGTTNPETFLTQVPGNLTTYTDTGAVTPGTAPAPSTDTGTGTGREIKQNASPLGFAQAWPEPSIGLVPGPGALITKILALNSSSQVTLNYSWPFTANPTGSTVTWGIDDTTPLQATIVAARNGPNRSIIFLPAAQYMITRKLVIGDLVYNAGAAGLMFSGAGNFGSDFGSGYLPVSCKSVIVWAGPSNQPMLEVFASTNLAFRDLALFGPTNQSASSSLGAPTAGIQLVSIANWNAQNIVIDNVTIGLCSVGLLMEYGTIANSDITANFLTFANCINFGLRDMCQNGLNYWMRSLYVASDATNNPNFVAAQFDQGGWLYWLGGNLISVPTVLKITNSGAGDNAANFVLDGLRIDSNNPNNQRCTIVDTLNNGAGVGGTNTIVVENVQLNAALGDGNHPLFNLGPNSNVTMRSSTVFFNAPIATMVSSGADTSLLLENINFKAQVAFAGAITADPGSFWRSRNCRVYSMPRFDESTWKGDGVVAPFRAACFTTTDPSGNLLCRGYFRPGNRPEKYIANEFPYLPAPGLPQLVYGTCTGVFRNNPSASPPVIPAVQEDQYPAWFDVNSYVTFLNGDYSTLFDLFSGDSTIIAWVRFPSSSLGRVNGNPIYSNLDTTAKTGAMLSINASNQVMFQVGDGSTIGSVTMGTNILADTWYLIAAVKQSGTSLKVYMFWPFNEWDTTAAWHGYTSSGKPRCIGQDNSVTPPQNVIGYIESLAIFAGALTQTQLQNLFNIGVNGG